MGILGFIKKFVSTTNEQTNQTATQNDKKFKIAFAEIVNEKQHQVPLTNTESGDYLSPTSFEHLTSEGDLPWGWVTHNKDFTEKINTEYSYFLHTWLDTKNKSPREQYAALKSFVMYLEDAEKLCKAKGECYEFWFYEILTSKDSVDMTKEELEHLTNNLDQMQFDYDKRNKELSDLDDRVIKILKEHQGILQSEFIKLFDPLIHSDVRGKLYYMEKDGLLERTKSGRSYTLNYKG